MKISKTFVLFVAAGLLVANVAAAKNFGGFSGGNKSSGNKSSNNNSGFKFSVGGSQVSKYLSNNNNNNKNYNNNSYNRSCHNNNYGQPYGQVYNQSIGRALEPFHSSYTVQPGDSFYEVSLKEYGTSDARSYIARYNRLQENAALVPGQTLMLPSVTPNGTMTASRAPAGESIYGPQGPVTQQFTSTGSTSPVANSPLVAAKPVAEIARTKVTVGSTLLVDGQSFGEKQGSARLRVGGLSLAIEVIEWTDSAVKIRLPQLELTSAASADIEVLRADGSLASKTAVELNTTTDQVAVTK